MKNQERKRHTPMYLLACKKYLISLSRHSFISLIVIIHMQTFFLLEKKSLYRGSFLFVNSIKAVNSLLKVNFESPKLGKIVNAIFFHFPEVVPTVFFSYSAVFLGT